MLEAQRLLTHGVVVIPYLRVHVPFDVSVVRLSVVRVIGRAKDSCDALRESTGAAVSWPFRIPHAVFHAVICFLL